MPLRQGLLLGFLCALLILGIEQFRGFDNLNQDVQDIFFNLRGARPVSPDVVLVVADQSTIEKRQWPLSRSLYAQIIERLNSAGAKVIGFDIAFSQPSPALQADETFAAACRKAGNIVHAAIFDPVAPPDSGVHVQPLKQPAAGKLEKFGIKSDSRSFYNALAVAAPLPGLQDSASAIGHIAVPSDADGALRRIAHLMRYEDHLYPSLALATAAQYLDVAPQSLTVRAANNGRLAIHLAPTQQPAREIPVDRDGKTWINWVGPSGAFPTFTFDQLLKGSYFEELKSSGVFKDRAVLVGVTAKAAFDFRATPFSDVQPAVELQANALNDILLNRPLREPALWAQMLLILSLALLTGALLAARGAITGVLYVAALSITLSGIAFLLFSKADFYIPIVAPVLAMVLVYGVSIGHRQINDARALQRTVVDLEQAEERYALSVGGANDGLWDWDLRSGKIYYSARWTEMLGYKEGELSDQPEEWFSRIHPDDDMQVKADLHAHQSNPVSHFKNEHRMRHRDGTYRWVLSRGLAIRDAAGMTYRMAGSQTDITQRKAVEQQLLHSALHDGLTGLPNRAAFINHLTHALELEKRRENYLFAVLFVDIDRFSVINESLGHRAGDWMLSEISKRLQKSLRPGDVVARLEGDEFAVWLDGVPDVTTVTVIANHIRSTLAEPLDIETPDGPQEIVPNASIGITLSETGYSKADDLLRDANIAMHRAKMRGRACQEIFDKQMHERALALLQLESDLRRAIENLDEEPEFFMVFQPIVALDTGKINGSEALIRWQHPQRGLVSPMEFITMAEETGWIVPLGQWVLRESCRELKVWQDHLTSLGRGDERLTISVNLSAKQLLNTDIVAEVRSILKETALEASQLKLEITESAIMENTEAAAAVMAELKTLGVSLSIDDFGTGYSSLSYLHRFPFDILKIDRSFIIRMGPGGEQSELVWTIIALARNLGMKVIAEGVETVEQMEYLKMLTCDFGQGYLFAKPLDAKAATEMITQNPQW